MPEQTSSLTPANSSPVVLPPFTVSSREPDIFWGFNPDDEDAGLYRPEGAGESGFYITPNLFTSPVTRPTPTAISPITPTADAVGTPQTTTTPNTRTPTWDELKEILLTPEGRDQEIQRRIQKAGGYGNLPDSQVQSIVNSVYEDLNDVQRTAAGVAARNSAGQGGPPLVLPLPIDPTAAILGTLILNRGNLENIFGGGIPNPVQVGQNVGGIITNPVGAVVETG